jgi:S-adenosylmethionine:tRNA ribosyltransferase-isomerase
LREEFNLRTYDYEYPQELLAHAPCENRSESRLLDYSREIIQHRKFSQLAEVFQEPCVFVRNNTRVRHARLFGKKETGGKVECLLTRRHTSKIWEGLFRPAKRLRQGQILTFSEGVSLLILESLSDGHFKVEIMDSTDLEEYLESNGQVPLPPYIREFEGEPERYQTVFSRELGSSAAPTAGLHFDEDLIRSLQARGHKFVDLTLHIGPGTFQPIDTLDIREFRIHKEFIEVSQECVDSVQQAMQGDIPVVCVGTTSLRALETVWNVHKNPRPYSGWTDLFLYPGTAVKTADYLLTNFHLPRSSLLVLVAALIGVRSMQELYNEALRSEYRLFSFGDCMCIPNLSRTRKR